MYGDDHKCEVSSRDLDSLRYDLERQIEDQRHQISRLEERLDSLRSEIQSLWEAQST